MWVDLTLFNLCIVYAQDALPLQLFTEGNNGHDEWKAVAVAFVGIFAAIGFGFYLGRMRIPDRDPNRNRIEKLLREIKEIVSKNNPPAPSA